MFQSDFWFIAPCLLNVPEEKIRERFDQMKHAVETMSLLSFLTGNDQYMKAMEEFEKWL